MAAITDLATVAGSALTSADYLVANDSGTDKKVAATDYAAVGKTNRRYCQRYPDKFPCSPPWHQGSLRKRPGWSS